jgi:hypothetical protein
MPRRRGAITGGSPLFNFEGARLLRWREHLTRTRRECRLFLHPRCDELPKDLQEVVWGRYPSRAANMHKNAGKWISDKPLDGSSLSSLCLNSWPQRCCVQDALKALLRASSIFCKMALSLGSMPATLISNCNSLSAQGGVATLRRRTIYYKSTTCGR